MLRKLLLTITIAVMVFLPLGCEQQQGSKHTSVSALEQAASGAVIKSPKDTREFATITLDNGMEVLLVQDDTSEISAVSLAVAVGSFQNPPQQQGLAHYLEHMLFLGTQKYPEPNTLQKFIDHNSGSWNAFTASDHTNFFFSLPADKLDEALDMFSDYFKAPLFDLSYSDKERNAINSEWSMGRSQDGRILQYLGGLLGNPEHPASRLAVGNLETLVDKKGSILNQELVNFYNKYYSANIMKLVMVSKLPLAEQEALVRKHFSDVKDRGIKAPVVTVPGVTEQQMGKKIFYRSVMDLKMLLLSFPIANNQSEWRSKPNQYIVNLLASEEPGTVAQQLREKNLVKALYARVDPTANDFDGSFDIYAELTDEGMGKRDEIIAAIFSYINLIKQNGVNQQYFAEQQAINKKKFDNMEMQPPLDTAIGLSEGLLDYAPRWVIAHPFVFESLNKEAVNNVLEDIQPERARIWYISQNENADTPVPYHEGAYREGSITRADVSRWKSLGEQMTFSLPAENDLFSESNAVVTPPTLLKPKLLKDENSTEVWLTHSKRFQGQKGEINIALNAPFSSDSAKNFMLAKMFASALNDQQLSLIDRAGQAGIGVQFFFNDTDVGVSLSEFNAKHALLVKRIFATLSEWNITDAEFARIKDSLRQDLINREKSPPVRQLGDLLKRQALAVSWTREDEHLAVEKLTKQDLLAYKEKLFGEARVRIFAYGNYTEDSVLTMASVVERMLGKTRKAGSTYKREFIEPKANSKTVYNEALTGHTDNAILIAYRLSQQGALGRAQLATLDAIVGNSFFTQLRTNEQLGYVVGTAVNAYDDYPALLFYVQSNTAELPALKARIDRFVAEFAAELAQTPAEVFAQIKSSQLAKLEKLPSDYIEELGPFLSDFYDVKLDYDSKQKLIAAFPKVTKESVVNLYNDLVLENGGAQTVVQLKGTAFSKTPFAE